MKKFALLTLGLLLGLQVAAFAKDKDNNGPKKNFSPKEIFKKIEHEEHEHDCISPTKRPKGWGEGKKTGWGGHDTPPGKNR